MDLQEFVKHLDDNYIDYKIKFNKYFGDKPIFIFARFYFNANTLNFVSKDFHLLYNAFNLNSALTYILNS